MARRRSERPLCDLLAPEANRRIEAIEDVPLTDEPVERKAITFALREALLFDTHAPVRAAAALQLARHKDAAAVCWLLEVARDDTHRTVREAALQAIGRLVQKLDDTVHAEIQHALLEEPVWWVRRTAARALVAIAAGDSSATAAAVELLERVLDDPFWRVRHTALQGLVTLGADVQADGKTASSAENVIPAGSTTAGEAARDTLDDPDPAVVAAHLNTLDAPAIDRRALVRFLGSSHETLRDAAARRLWQYRDHQVLRQTLAWLDRPLWPHASATVLRLLDRLGTDAAALAGHALLGGGTNATIWAVRWVATYRWEALYGEVQRCISDERPEVRAAALLAWVDIGEAALGLLDPLLEALQDVQECVHEAALQGLCHLAAVDKRAGEAIDQIELGSETTAIRLLLLDRAAASGRREVLTAALNDAHAGVRARGVVLLSRNGWLDETARSAAQGDEDPWMRAAALDLEAARERVTDDLDPWVRRAAMRKLVAGRRQIDNADRLTLATRIMQADDSWLRAEACRLLDLHHEDVSAEIQRAALRMLLVASRDRTLMVRGAAADLLGPSDELQGRLREVLEREKDEGVRVAVYSHLLRGTPEAVREQLREVQPQTEPPVVREHLEQIATFLDEAPAPQPQIVEQTWARRAGHSPVPTNVQRRQLGTTGLSVAPLALSGAYEVSASALRQAHAAGANLFFWEPRYREMSRFLRRRPDETLVVAGSFHADRKGIERDVETCLRRLRRERVDIFLLFWARSPARLSTAAFEILSRLKAAGKIGAIGFSTHDRQLAAKAIGEHPWDVVMTRHNAAHTGAEQELFPLCTQRGVGVLTFSALCYGRMLRAVPGQQIEKAALPRAVDCYRYSLRQDAVAACISAPRRYREIITNLDVLAQPHIDEQTARALVEHGQLVYAENKRFDRLVRRPEGTQTARQAALQWLAGDDTPEAAVETVRLAPTTTLELKQ